MYIYIYINRLLYYNQCNLFATFQYLIYQQRFIVVYNKLYNMSILYNVDCQYIIYCISLLIITVVLIIILSNVNTVNLVLYNIKL